MDFYVMAFGPNDNVEYFKVYFNELYKLYKNRYKKDYRTC